MYTEAGREQDTSFHIYAALWYMQLCHNSEEPLYFFVGTLFVYKNERFYLSYINFILAIWRAFWYSIKYFIRFLRNRWSWWWFILYTIINCHFQLMVNLEQWDWEYFLKTVFQLLMMYSFCHDFEMYWKNAPNKDSWRCQLQEIRKATFCLKPWNSFDWVCVVESWP